MIKTVTEVFLQYKVFENFTNKKTKIFKSLTHFDPIN